MSNCNCKYNDLYSVVGSKLLLGEVQQRCTTFFGQEPQCMIFNALEGRRQNYELNFRKSSIKTDFKNLTRVIIACGLILLPPGMFRIVISCKIVNSSIKLKFTHKSPSFKRSVLYLFNLLQEPDIIHSRAGSGPRFVHPCFTRLLRPTVKAKCLLSRHQLNVQGLSSLFGLFHVTKLYLLKSLK